MDDDIIEKPSCKILFRQSSLETRLSPARLSDRSSSDSEDEAEKNTPKVIDYKTKPGQSSTCERIPGPGNFKNELERKLKAVSSTRKRDNNQLAHVLKNQTKGKVAVTPTIGFNDELMKKLQESKNINNTEQYRNEKENMSASMEQNITVNSDDNLQCEILSSNVLKPSAPPKPLQNEMEKVDISLVGSIKALSLPKKEVQLETVGGSVGCDLQESGSRREDMATARPKSPRPVAIKGEKDESIWDKLGTLGRKKRIKEVQEVQAEGKYAIDSPGCPAAPVIPPEEYNLDDNEERCMIDKGAYGDRKFIELINVLIEWINDELASQRIIVQNLAEDLYDGQVLQKLLEKLTGDKLDVPEVTQSEEGQKQKLSVVLGHFNQVLGIQKISHNKWSVEAIHSKNIVSIIHLLVALARHFRPPVRLPEHVSVDVVVVQKAKGILNHKVIRESLTKAYDDVGMRCERDAFDTLFDHAPDKLQVVKKSLVTFVNKHLSKMNFEVTEIESQFHDGVYLIMLMGLLEGFFVPHYNFHLTPHEFEQKVHNVNFAFELMEEVGLQKPKARPEDVVNMDLKSTLRVLYNLFLKYKTIL